MKQNDYNNRNRKFLCIAFFLICFWGTGTDNKNLKSYSSYPDEVQNRIKSIAEYQGKFKESNKVVTFYIQFSCLFCSLLFIIRVVYQRKWLHT